MSEKLGFALRGVGVGTGALFLVACVLPDYQPPSDNGTTSVGGSSASAGTSGGGMGGMGASSSSTGTGGAGEEADCTNGQDDDGDGMPDCADPDCVPGYACVPAQPTDPFMQYGRARQANIGTQHATCPGGSNPIEGFFLNEWPSECTACGCTPTAECAPPTVSAFGDGQCVGAETTIPVVSGKLCYPFPAPGPLAIQVSPGQVANPQCSGSTGTQVHPEPWQKYVDFCPVDKIGAGCDPGQVCVAKSTPDYGDRVCAAAEGIINCPAEFPKKIVTSKNWTDDRKCAACSCDASAVFCEGGGVVLNNAMSCQGLGNTPVVPEKCTSLDGTGAQAFKVPPASPSLPVGGCMQGAATGAVQSTQSVTFCCNL